MITLLCPALLPEKPFTRLRCLLALLLLLSCASAALAQTPAPRVFSLDPLRLKQAKERLASKDATLTPALARLRRAAEQALSAGPFSVTSKERTPPSGDKHDYLTLAPYWWPDPAQPNGLPYIRRDGETNPESKRDTDQAALRSMAEHVETLALAYYFTGEEQYAARAALLLRAWFLDKETKMNPHFTYAQAILGRNDGRGAGLIDARRFIRVLDSVGLLAGARAWTKQDQQGVEAWFRAFVQWMQTSANGKDEAAARNNHGSWYAAQLAACALFLGDEALARKTVEAVKARIAWQIEPDGRQPLELARTRGLSYSLFNLEALLTAAAIGGKLGVDLWNYETKDGRGLSKALAYLAPFAFGEKKWPHQQISEWMPEEYFALLRQAAGKFRDERFQALLTRVPAVAPAAHSRLLD